jgi:DNA-3-methyladenine glycosylase II
MAKSMNSKGLNSKFKVSANRPTVSRSQSASRWAAAVRHLRRVDPHLRAIIDRIGPCRLVPAPDRFGALVRSIVSQQISTKAAMSISRRLAEISGSPYHPSRIIALADEQLRGAGLSAAKARYIRNLAEAVAAGDLPLDDIDDSWGEEEIRVALTTVKGIGVWTAEMFLIFVLNRPDILPASDLGVRAALRARHGLADLPKPRDCHALADLWRPYRTVASWYLWKNTDTPKDKPADLAPRAVGSARSRKSLKPTP